MPYTWICIMSATLALNTIFIVSLLASLSWDQRAMLLFATGIIAGGLLFTIRTIQRLNKLN